jgi:hypothetical protein
MTCSGLEPGPGHKPWQQTALTTDKSTLEDNLYLSTKDALFSARSVSAGLHLKTSQ